MAVSIGSVKVDVIADVPQDAKRLRALELAVESRGPVSSGDSITEDAGRFLAFLNGES